MSTRLGSFNFHPGAIIPISALPFSTRGDTTDIVLFVVRLVAAPLVNLARRILLIFCHLHRSVADVGDSGTVEWPTELPCLMRYVG